jgi:hypothetical protein
VAGPTTLGVRVASSWSGLYDTYDDFAPEPGTPSFAFVVSFAAGVPARPPPAGTRTQRTVVVRVSKGSRAATVAR